MADKQTVASHSRAAVRARFAFFAIAALSFLFVQSLLIAAHANPKTKKYSLGRVKIFTSTGSYPLRIDGQSVGSSTPFVWEGNTQTFEQKIDLPPGSYTLQITFPNNERWVRPLVIEAGRIYCVGLAYTPKITKIIKPEYCKPFGQINVRTQPKYKRGDLVTFEATVGSYSGDVDLIYTWSVTAGTIIRGQGTREIEVDTAGLVGATNITATVTVDEGSGRPLPPGSTLLCHAVADATTVPEPKVFDVFNDIAFDDVKARLDNFVIQAQDAPDTTAYVIYYSGNKCPSGQRSSLGDRSVEYMINTRGFDRSRVKLINGGKSTMDWVELWVLPLGAQPPTPRPDFPLSGHPDAPKVSKANKQYPCVKTPLDEPRQEGSRY
jgi:hypothetical protein